MKFSPRPVMVRHFIFVASALLPLALSAAVPPVLNHQGRLAVNGVNFEGSGQFKFSLVNSSGTATYWSNDGTGSAGSQPTAAVTLAVSKGLYAVLLGDSSLSNMTAVPTSVFDNADVRLRVWFNDGSNGFQLMTPDQRLAASPYALTADKANSATSATGFSGSLAGEVTGTQGETAISATTVTGKVLTGFVAGAGTLSSADTVLSAINKLDGNVALKAPLSSPTFTGTVGGVTASMVGLGNVSNTSDASKPVSTAQQTALDLKSNLSSPTFTGTVSGSFSGPLAGNATTATTATNFTGSLAGDVTGTQGVTTISAATVTGKALTGYVSGSGTVSATDTILMAINKLNGNDGLKANLASPTFAGTVTLPAGTSSVAPLKLATGVNLTTAVFGSVEFDGTSLYLTNNSATPTRKTIAFTDTAIASGAVGSSQLASGLTLGGTTTGTFSGPLTGSVTGNVTGSAASFTGSLVGDVTGTQGATAIAAATVTGKALTGYVSGSGTVSATDTILAAINKLNGNDGLKANLASPTFTGTVNGITASMVGLGNVSNTSDASKPVSTAQQTALDLKANLASPTFTGTVNGVTASMVGLGNVTNTSDASKPVSTAQQTALDLKANLASPSFSGTVALAAGSSSAAPLRLATGTNLTTAVLGSVEFDGSNLYLTTNASSPTRKTVALSDSSSSSQIPLANVVAAPLKPVVAWGYNHDGQTSVPALANVAAVAAGSAHSLALLDAGTVVAWGLNTDGQATVPPTLSGVTEIAAGTSHSLARKSDGSLVAWGNNTYGQTTIPSGITTATKVAAGEKHSMALLANGSVRAWGENYYGQITIPAGLTGVTVTAIAAGYEHSLALTAGGTVVAWGRSDASQIAVPVGLTGVTAIAAGAYHSLALKSDGTVVAWGWDNAGQVAAPAAWSGVVKIAGGYGCSLAAKADGTLIVGGDNSYFQKILPTDATQVIAIAAGANHLIALRADSIPAQVARLDQDNLFTGSLGIKRTPAVNALEVEGSASKTIAGNWLANSDRRIKTEIQSITGALEKIDQVRLVDFRYTDEYRAAHPGIDDLRYPNVIAQEFAEVFPDDVKSSGERMADGSPILQVDTYPLTIYSAAAVQELHRDSQALHRDNQALHRENQALKRQAADQEQRLRKLEAILAK